MAKKRQKKRENKKTPIHGMRVYGFPLPENIILRIQGGTVTYEEVDQGKHKKVNGNI